jgi:hypothetical protein
MKSQNTFETLGKISVADKVKKKGRFEYLSWAWAWHVLKQNYPDAQRIVYENAEGVPYFTDGKFANVKVGIVVGGMEHIDYLPVLDNLNRAIPLTKLTSFNVNTAIQRSTAKAIALHGLGLSLWIDEDTTKSWDNETKAAPVKTKEKYTLKVGDHKWDSMLRFIEANKSKGFEWIVGSISKGYNLSEEVNLEIKKQLSNGKKGSTKKATK